MKKIITNPSLNTDIIKNLITDILKLWISTCNRKLENYTFNVLFPKLNNKCYSIHIKEDASFNKKI